MMRPKPCRGPHTWVRAVGADYGINCSVCFDEPDNLLGRLIELDRFREYAARVAQHSPIVGRPKYWWQDHLNLLAVYEWLHGLDDDHPMSPVAFSVTDYLAKPWHWDPEWRAYLAAGGVDQRDTDPGPGRPQ